MKPTLEQLRAEIDRLDGQILPLLNRRAELALEIGAIKHANGSALYVPSRERDVLRRLMSINEGPLSHRSVCRIYAEIMRSSLAIEHKAQVIAIGAAQVELRTAVRFVAGDHVDVCMAADVAEVARLFSAEPESLLVVSDEWLTSHAGQVASMKAEWRGAWRVPVNGHEIRFHLLVHPEQQAMGERPATVYCLVDSSGFSGGVPPGWVREVPAVAVEYAVSPMEPGWGILQLRMELSAREVRENWAGRFAGHCRAVWIVS